MTELVGVLLAGGAGSRLGGNKASAPLAGRPLAGYALTALKSVTGRQVVVAKEGTALPDLGVEQWIEPESLQHPLAGIVHALRQAGGPVLVLAADMPLVTPAQLRRVSAAAKTARVARAAGRLQPLCARYEQAALAALQDFADGDRLTERVLALDPAIEEFEEEFFNVNTPADLELAEGLLAAAKTAT